jgi:hypothetical protein
VTETTHNSDQRHTGRRLQYRAVPISQIPPPEGYSSIDRVDWTEARRTLDRGDAVCFRVPVHAVVPLWQTAQAQLGPVALRYNHKRGEVYFYPLPTPRAYRARANQSVSPDELSRMHAQAARLRGDALIRFVVSDAVHCMADQMQRGLSRREALAEFVTARGARYPIRFDAAVFEEWTDILSADPDLAAALGRSPSPAESNRKRPPPNGGKR